MRYWLHPAGRDSRLLNGQQLISADLHPLRCIFLGLCESLADAKRKATDELCATPPQSVIAKNIRMACDHRQTKRWRLSEQEIDLLIAGAKLEIKDGLGRFVVGYSRLD